MKTSRVFCFDFKIHLKIFFFHFRYKLARLLHGIVLVLKADCLDSATKNICDDLGRSGGLIFYPAKNVDKQHETVSFFLLFVFIYLLYLNSFKFLLQFFMPIALNAYIYFFSIIIFVDY